MPKLFFIRIRCRPFAATVLDNVRSHHHRGWFHFLSLVISAGVSKWGEGGGGGVLRYACEGGRGNRRGSEGSDDYRMLFCIPHFYTEVRTGAFRFTESNSARDCWTPSLWVAYKAAGICYCRGRRSRYTPVEHHTARSVHSLTHSRTNDTNSSFLTASAAAAGRSNHLRRSIDTTNSLI